MLPKRGCGTPGCSLPDFHNEPCSTQQRSGRRGSAARGVATFSSIIDEAIAKINSGVVALGHWEGTFALADYGRTWFPMPHLGQMTLEQWTSLLDHAMRPDACAIILAAGGQIPEALHSAVLHLFAERLPGSSLVALNLGGFTHADDSAYDALAKSVAQASCVLGHLYIKGPVSPAEMQRKQHVCAQLLCNCAKPGYLQQLARNEVWSLGGANCWRNFSSALRERALAAVNDAILVREPQLRWSKGAIHFSIAGSHPRKTLSYLQDRHNYDSKGFLIVGSQMIGGFSNEYRTHAKRFDAALQWQHSRHFPHSMLRTARRQIPGFAEIIDGAYTQLPETHHAGFKIHPLHINILNQSSALTRLGDHDDLDEELQAVDDASGGAAVRDRKVLYTAIVSLAGGETSLRILGQLGGEIDFGTQVGSGLIFRSALTHKTEQSGKGIWKMTIFFGYLHDATTA